MDHEFCLLLALEDVHDRATLGRFARLLRLLTRRVVRTPETDASPGAPPPSSGWRKEG
jgi:hypothetical protein